MAWLDPVDWSDLSLYAFYALENAVMAAADQLGVTWERTHPSKVAAARALHQQNGLPDVAPLLQELNEIRKSESYGEVRPPSTFDAEDIAVAVEDYVEAVDGLIRGSS